MSSNNIKKTFDPIVFLNKPATNYEQDVVGFQSQIKTIKKAIDDGANMIGLIADYGTGKSTVSEILASEVLSNRKLYSVIRINMWDSISNSEHSEHDITELTKSFLFQLSQGSEDKKCTSKLSSYVSKRLSKNFNTISFSTISTKLVRNAILSAIFYVAYKVFSQENMPSLIQYFKPFAGLCKEIYPMFLMLSLMFLLVGLKDTSIAFASWKRTSDNHLEINDIFELYDNIAEKLIENSYDNKQIVIIEDLDRIDDKNLIISFLKELYRFQNSVHEKIKDKFVFIISIKPEIMLKTKPLSEYKSSENSEDLSIQNDNVDNDANFENLYSKVFDIMINLNPIHFEDYESALIAMLKRNKESKKQLEEIIDCKEEIDNQLPESFKWILTGENLTLRDLKDRLNHAISIMTILKNKNYKEVTNINFTACTAVAYLESAFPSDFYNLVKNEIGFESLIRKSYAIKNDSELNTEDKLESLVDLFEKAFEDKEIKFDNLFVNRFCGLVLDNTFDDDFRMYFYTYPDNSYIKTVDEKDIYNLIKLPNIYNDYTNLDKKVNRVFSKRPNTILKNTIRNMPASEPYPIVLLKNDSLLELSIQFNKSKSIDLLSKYTLQLPLKDDLGSIIERVNRVSITNKELYMRKYESEVASCMTNNKWATSDILQFRKILIQSLGKDILYFSKIFVLVSNDDQNLPHITEEEINLIDDIGVVLDLIDIKSLCEYDFHVLSAINKQKTPQDYYQKAISIYDLFIEIIPMDGSFSNLLLDFLTINHKLHDEYFSGLISYMEDKEKVCNYVNAFDAEELSETYLQCIDKLAVENGLNDDILEKLKEGNYYISYLLSTVGTYKIQNINYGDSQVAESIIKASPKIYLSNRTKFLEIRKCIIEQLQQVYDLYNEFFESERYPEITKDELNTFLRFTDAMMCIDGRKITVDNCDFIWEYCNQDIRDADECKSMFDNLFNIEYESCISDGEVINKLINSFDFDKIQFSKMNETDKEKATGWVYDALELDDINNCIKYMNKIKTIIPSLEKKVQDNIQDTEDSDIDNYYIPYIQLLNSLKQVTETSLHWLKDSKLKVGLCPEITNALYDKKYYKNYVVGKSLYENELYYNKDIVSVEDYFNIYISNMNITNLMIGNNEFIKDIIEKKLYTKLKSKKLLSPIFIFPQTVDMVKHIFSQLDKNECQQYILSIEEIATDKDSIAIQKFLCEETNMERLGRYDVKDKIMILLWEDRPTHKIDFRAAWNKRWKKELRKLPPEILD